MLPAEAQDHERVRSHLNGALNAMNAAVDGVPLQYAQPGGAAGAGYSYAGGAGARARVGCFLLFCHKTKGQETASTYPGERQETLVTL